MSNYSPPKGGYDKAQAKIVGFFENAIEFLKTLFAVFPR